MTEDELAKNPKEAKAALKGILDISKKKRGGKFTWKGRPYSLALGLPDVAKKKIKEALKFLAGGTLAIPAPRVRW